MTRIGNDGASGPDKDALRAEIRSEMQNAESQRRRRGCFGCLFALGMLVLVPSVVGLVLAAKSGFYKAPGLAGLYEPPVPTRDVLPLVGQTVEQVAQAGALKATVDPHTSLLRLPAREEELTTFAADAVSKAAPGSLPFPVRRVQVAVETEWVELFAVGIAEDGSDVAMRVRFRPRVEGERTTFDVIEARSGSLEVPRGVAEALIDAIFGSTVFNSRQQLAALGRLTDVELAPHVLTLVFYRR